jgi:hypothetical protein
VVLQVTSTQSATTHTIYRCEQPKRDLSTEKPIYALQTVYLSNNKKQTIIYNKKASCFWLTDFKF